MLICTGLGDNYSNLVTTAVHTIGTADFTPDKIIPIAKSQRQGTSLANHISSNKAKTIKQASSEHCKIYCGTSHKTENCWKLTRKPGSAGNSGNQNKQNQQKTQQNTGNQSFGWDNKKKGKGRGKGKGKGKGKANKTHVADEAMILMSQSKWTVYHPFPLSSLENQENHQPQGSMMMKYLIGVIMTMEWKAPSLYNPIRLFTECPFKSVYQERTYMMTQGRQTW